MYIQKQGKFFPVTILEVMDNGQVFITTGGGNFRIVEPDKLYQNCPVCNGEGYLYIATNCPDDHIKSHCTCSDGLVPLNKEPVISKKPRGGGLWDYNPVGRGQQGHANQRFTSGYLGW